MSETAARTGIDNTPNPTALERLQKLCALLEEVRQCLYMAPMLVTSGYRSPKVNALVRGAPGSQHMKGEAADFIAPRFGTPFDIVRAIERSAIQYDQLICEFANNGGGWVHISVSDTPRREALVVTVDGTQPFSA